MNVRYYEKRPGNWWLDFRVDGVRYRVSAAQATEADARRAAPAIIAQVLTKAPTNVINRKRDDSNGPTLQEAFDLAMRTREQWITSKDKTTIRQTFDRLMGPALQPSDPCSKLTRPFVQALRLRWMEEPGKRKDTTLSPSTINHRLSMLSVLLEVLDLPPHTVKHLSTRGNSRKRRITDAEIAAAQSWCYAQAETRKNALDLADLITCGIGTGARESELLPPNLQWRHVAAATITFEDTKNGLTRTIPLRPSVKAVLEARKHLPTPFHGLTADRVTALWAQMRTALNKQDDHQFVFHLLRHESVSRMIDDGKNTLAIQMWHGHESVTTTQGYASVGMKALRQLVDMAPLELVA